MTLTITPVFVEFIPEEVEDGKLYISEKYATAVHRCCCGCGHKVVTPLSPTNWKLSVRAGRVSLYPSIGNWGFPCQSHYWIADNEVEWSYKMTKQQIEAGRRQDSLLKERYYRSGSAEPKQESAPLPQPRYTPGSKQSWWTRVKKWFSIG